MKHKVYLAGPLFSKYEYEIRKKEAEEFKKTFPNIEVFAPVNAPFNGGNPTNEEIFELDNKAIQESDIFIFDLNNITDTGTFLELGLALQRKQQDPSIKVYAHLWDLRMNRTAGKLPYEKPWGFNAFVLGGVMKYGKLLNNFEEILEEMKKDGF